MRLARDGRGKGKEKGKEERLVGVAVGGVGSVEKSKKGRGGRVFSLWMGGGCGGKGGRCRVEGCGEILPPAAGRGAGGKVGKRWGEGWGEGVEKG